MAAAGWFRIAKFGAACGRMATHWSLALATLSTILVLRALDPFPVEILRLKGFDWIQSSGELESSEDVVLIDIDEAAIDAEGQWPWPRSRMADLVRRLRDAGAGSIVLTVLFSEPDRFGQDAALATELSDGGVIVAQQGTIYRSVGGVARGVSRLGDPTAWLFAWPGMLGPIETIAASAAGVGVTNAAPEIDGVVRRLPVAITAAGKVYPSLALETLRVAADAPSWSIKTAAGGVVAARVSGFPPVWTDANGRIWLQGNHVFQRYASTAELEDLQGRIVVVGLTAEGLGGIVATPTGERYAHDLVAAMIQTMLSGSTTVRPDIALPLEMLAIATAGILVLATAVLAPYWAVALVMSALLGSIAGTAVLAWHLESWLLDVTAPTAAVLLVGLHATFNRFAREFRMRQQIRRQFEHYLSPPLVRELQRDPSRLVLGGETRDLTILFCDIRGFTPISEQFKTDPQGLTRLINRFLTPMTWVIMENSGTIDKFMGDCIMAFWNAPLDVPRQHHAAITAAMQMQEALHRLNAELEAEGRLPIHIGIGINSGPCVVGNVGSEQRFDYSALGDAVNLASRLEGQSKSYGVTLVLGEAVVGDIAGFVFVELDLIAVKGKSEGVRIYTCIGAAPENSGQAGDLFPFAAHEEFLSVYRMQMWDDAEEMARRLATEAPVLGEYYILMAARISELRAMPPPPDWDGVYRATTK